MNIRIATLTILLTPLFICASTTSDKFAQCPNTDRLEKQLEIVLALMQHRETIEFQARQRRLEQAQAQQKEQEELVAKFEALPGWQKKLIAIYAPLHPVITEQLWPTVKSILISLLAQKIVSTGLDTADFFTGTLPEKAGIPLIALRFGEGLTLNKTERENNANVRKLEKDPEYQRLKKYFKNPQHQVDLAVHELKQQKESQERNLENIATEKTIDEKVNTWKQSNPQATSEQINRQRKVFERKIRDPLAPEVESFQKTPEPTNEPRTEDAD